MIFFIDTEFSDFKHPTLLSVGIVSNTNKTFYFERNDVAHNICNEFVKNNVLSLFSNKQETSGSISDLEKKLNSFFNEYKKIVLVGDYKYDWLLLIPLLSEENLNKTKIYNIAKFSIIYAPNIDEYFEASKFKRHHALNDAVALKKCFFGIHQDYRSIEKYSEVIF